MPLQIFSNDRFVRAVSISGGETQLPYDFPLYDAADVRVWLIRAGVISLLVDPDDYSPDSIGVEAGGNINLVVAAVIGDIYDIVGRWDPSRTANFTGSGFSPDAINLEFNRLVTGLQEVRRDLDNAVRLRPGGDKHDAQSLPIANLADGLVSTDATSLGQVTNLVNINVEATGYTFTYDAVIIKADPGSQELRFDTLVLGSIARLWISETAIEGAIGPFLDIWDDSNSTVKGYIRLTKISAKTNWVLLQIDAVQTDEGAFREFTVSVVTSQGAFVAGDLLAVSWLRNGDLGVPAVASFNSRTGAVVPTAGDYDAFHYTEAEVDTLLGLKANLANPSFTGNISVTGTVDGRDVAADGTKLDFLTVTQAVDLDAIETRINDLDASVVLRGTWNASSGSFPGGGTAQAGDSYIVSTGGTVDSVTFAANDRIIAIADNASTTTFASNWHKADYTDEVLSVAGKTGAVTLAPADVVLANAERVIGRAIGAGAGAGVELTRTQLTALLNLATASVQGAVELATEAEVHTGTDTSRVAPVSEMKPREAIILAVSDETTSLSTGTAQVTFRMPYGFELADVRASVKDAPTGSVLTVDINEGGTTILSTKLTIDISEKTSETAAAAAVISDSTLADDAEITIDIDTVGSTIAGAGLKVALIGNRT